MTDDVQLPDIELSAPAGGVAGAEYAGTLRLPPALRRPDAVVKIQLAYKTEGKGNTDEGGVEYVVSQGRVPADPLPFAIVLPREPWSYQGKILKIAWTLRVLVEFEGGAQGLVRELVIGSPFVR